MQSNCHQIADNLSEIQKLKADFDTLLVQGEKTQDTETSLGHLNQAESLQRELEIRISSLREQFHVSPEQAERIMGPERFLGPQDLERAFGFQIKPQDIPPIPFKKEELELHQRLGHMLVLNLSHAPDGTPLTIETMAKLAIAQIGSNVIERDQQGNPAKYLLYKDQFDDQGNLKTEAWFKNETQVIQQTPKAGWQFVSPNILPDSTGKDYLKQTELLIQYAKQNVFAGSLPVEYQTAETEFKKRKPEIAKLIKQGDYIKASQILSTLQVSRLLREPVQNTIFRYLVAHKKGQQLFTDGNYSWSSRTSSGGALLRFGDANATGARVRGNQPGNEWSGNGVVFSCS